MAFPAAIPSVGRESAGQRPHEVLSRDLARELMPTSPTTFVAAGDPVDAVVFEAHRGTLTDRRDQVDEDAAQILFADPRQTLSWQFAAGHTDHFARRVLCGAN
jgi:hypothetical protein